MINLTYKGITDALQTQGQGTKQQVLNALEKASPAELTMLAHSFMHRASELRKENQTDKVTNLKKGLLYDGPIYRITETAERYQVWIKEEQENGDIKVRIANSLSKRCNFIEQIIAYYSQLEEERLNS